MIEVLDVDITTLEVDAIANAANAQLLHGGGVAGAIARAAGPELERESRARAPIEVGSAVETTGGSLPARFVIHAATMAAPGGRTDADIVRRASALGYRALQPLGIEIPRLTWFDWGGFAFAWIFVGALIGLLAWLASLGR